MKNENGKPKREWKPPPGKKYIFRPWITGPDGKRIYAYERGIKAFPILVDE